MFLPLYFKTHDLPCLIIGGGAVAARKVDMLLSVFCPLSVIAPTIDDHIRKAVERGRVRWQEREYMPGDCRGFHLVIAATPHAEINRAVSAEARGLGIPVNVVDIPELCTVIFGAVWRDGPLTVAVSSGGEAPFMAAAVRDRISEYLTGMGEWVEAAGAFRAVIRSEVSDPAERDRLYRLFVACSRTGIPTEIPQSPALRDWIEWLNHPRIEE